MSERTYLCKFGNNLRVFFEEMKNRGYEVTWMGSYGVDVVIDYNDLDEVTYQAENYEGCNVTLENGDCMQTVAVNYTGDDWCDVVPIVDWSFQRNKVDVVDEVMTMLHQRFLGEDA